MKKMIALMAAILFVLTLSACNNKNTESDTDTNVSAGSEASVKPENNASAEMNSENTQSTEETATKKEESESKRTTTTKPAASSETEKTTTTTPKTEGTTTTTTTTKPTEGEPAHTHKFSAATCTEAQKCSCGATVGSPLGHKWQEATCKAPKTCSVCKATEGNIGNHKYTNGKCIYCGDKQKINPKTGLKKYKDYYCVSADQDGHYTLFIWQFNGTTIQPKDFHGGYSTNEEWKESDDTITYKGRTFYHIGYGFDGSWPQYTLTDTEIILRQPEPELAHVEYRLIVNVDYDLEVIYSSDGIFFKKGDILDLVE